MKVNFVDFSRLLNGCSHQWNVLWFDIFTKATKMLPYFFTEIVFCDNQLEYFPSLRSVSSHLKHLTPIIYRWCEMLLDSFDFNAKKRYFLTRKSVHTCYKKSYREHTPKIANYLPELGARLTFSRPLQVFSYSRHF